MRTINEHDIRAILYGVSFLAGGGGGSLFDGLDMLDYNIKKRGSIQIQMMDIDELREDAYAVMIAGMGAPSVLKQKEEKFRYEAGYTYDGMVEAAKRQGKRIEAIYPIEYGSVNYMIPFIAAMERNVPIVDVDGCGRAVPGLDTTLLNINKIAFCPSVACDDKENMVHVYTKDPFDCVTAEKICRNLCGGFDFVMGLGGWIASAEELKEKAAVGAIAYAETVGKVILQVKERGGDIYEELRKVMELRPAVTGKVVKQETVMSKAHDIGYSQILGEDGKTYFVDIKNESIVFRSEDEVLLTCPDMLCAVNLDTMDPTPNSDVNEGDRIAYFAVPAPRAWFNVPEGTTLWKPYFEAVGYHGDVVAY